MNESVDNILEIYFLSEIKLEGDTEIKMEMEVGESTWISLSFATGED